MLLFNFACFDTVTAVIADGSIRLQAIENIPEHSFFSMSYDHNNSSDLFIFRGRCFQLPLVMICFCEEILAKLLN